MHTHTRTHHIAHAERKRNASFFTVPLSNKAAVYPKFATHRARSTHPVRSECASLYFSIKRVNQMTVLIICICKFRVRK